MEIHIQEQAISKTIVLNFVGRVLLWPCGSSVIVLSCFRGYFVCPKHLFVGILWSSKLFLVGTLWDGNFFQVGILWVQHFFLWVFRRSNFFFVSWALLGPEKFALHFKIFFRDQFLKKAGTRLRLKLCFLFQKDFKSCELYLYYQSSF